MIAGCAPAVGPLRVSPEQIPVLEATLRADTADAGTRIHLAAAYREAGRLDDARVLLEGTRADAEAEAQALLLLGVTYEDLARPADARAAYERYLAVGRSDDLRSHVSGRLELVRRAELVQLVQNALRREAELSTMAPEPAAVAVFPFLFAAQDTALRPVARAVAQFLATDLGRVGRITVLERAAVSALLQEWRLAESMLVDQATAVRSGYLLRAGRVVQGRVDGDATALALETALVTVRPGETAAPRTIAQRDALDRLLDLEKQLALEVFASMGVQLTDAERDQVLSRPTGNLQAVLAYGRGLEAMDAGNYAVAAQHFAEATRLDGGFEAARTSAQRASGAAAAASVSTADLATRVGEEAVAVVEAFDAGDLLPDPAVRDPAAEILGNEGVGRRTILEIIIRR
jgi:tetratricopeptide (TPR) repeat protein